ncbi:hypothetical protein C2S51_030661 [Perilla frutescens var. frutescens]|nr:hypothetical protein C2S51_030661 [Perilla frutescens var. frutescens]
MAREISLDGALDHEIWAYEAITRVRRHCAKLVSDVAILRCLKWNFSDKAVRIGTLFNEEELSCHLFLDPTEYEENLPYFRSTLFENPVGVLYVVKLQQKKRPRKVTRSRELTLPRSSTPPRAVTPPKASTTYRTVTPHRASTSLRALTPATLVARSISRRSVGCLPCTCENTGAMDTTTEPTSGRRRGKLAKTFTSSSGTSEGHVYCHHMDSTER